MEYTEVITKKKVFTKKEVEAAKEQTIKDRIYHSLQETEGKANLERIEKISQDIMNEFTEEEIMQMLEYLFYKDMSIREGGGSSRRCSRRSGIPYSRISFYLIWIIMVKHGSPHFLFFVGKIFLSEA